MVTGYEQAPTEVDKALGDRIAFCACARGEYTQRDAPAQQLCRERCLLLLSPDAISMNGVLVSDDCKFPGGFQGPHSVRKYKYSNAPMVIEQIAVCNA